MAALISEHDAFHDALQALVRRSGEHVAVNQAYAYAYVPQYEGQQNFWKPVAVLDRGLVAELHRRVWDGWEEFEKLVETTRTDAAMSEALLTDISHQPTAAEQHPTIIGNHIVGFMLDYLDAAQDDAAFWNEMAFEALFRDYVASAERLKWSLTTWAPLLNFAAEDFHARSELVPGCDLLEPDERTIARLSRLSTSYELPIRLPPRHYLSSSVELPLKAIDVSHGVRGPIPDALLAIRLTVGGDVKPQQIYCIPAPGQCRLGMGMAAFSIAPTGVHSGQQRSILRPSQASQLRKVFSALPKLRSQYPVATSRFAELPERWSAADRLVDSTIGLESLLLKEDEMQESTFKFALRGAWLLAPSDRALREKWLGRLNNVYANRSKIVHGNSKIMGKLRQEVASDSIEALRDLLNIVVDSGLDRTAWDDRLKGVVLG